MKQKFARAGLQGLHADRAAGGHRGHRGDHWAALAGGTVRPRSRPPRQCTNNLKQIGLGVHNYISSNDVFPWGLYRQHASRVRPRRLRLRPPEEASFPCFP